MTTFSVPTIKLLDGTTIPQIAWGNGTGSAKPTAVQSGIKVLQSGIMHIDTAQGYDNETQTGEAIQKSGCQREEVYVTTKLSNANGWPLNDAIPLSTVKDSIKASIKRLGFHPNLLLVHSPHVAEKGKFVELWKILEEMKDSGELKASLGVSNFRCQDYEELLPHVKHVPVINQLEMHPYLLSASQPIFDIQNKHGIKTAAYGPLTPILRHSNGGRLKPVLEKIAQRYSKEHGKEVDSHMILLLWYRAKEIVAVTASGSEGNIKKIALTQSLPDLAADEVKEIEELGRQVHYRYYGEHMLETHVPDLPDDLSAEESANKRKAAQERIERIHKDFGTKPLEMPASMTK